MGRFAGEEDPETNDEPKTAQEVIARNLKAVGGAERIGAVKTMALHGASGSALLPPSERVTVYLAAPNRLKQVGAFRIILCDGTRCVNNKGETTEAVKAEPEMGSNIGSASTTVASVCWLGKNCSTSRAW